MFLHVVLLKLSQKEEILKELGPCSHKCSNDLCLNLQCWTTLYIEYWTLIFHVVSYIAAHKGNLTFKSGPPYFCPRSSQWFLELLSLQSPNTVEPIKAQLTRLSEGFTHRPGVEAAAEVKRKRGEEGWAKEIMEIMLCGEMFMNFRWCLPCLPWLGLALGWVSIFQANIQQFCWPIPRGCLTAKLLAQL